MFFIYFMFNLIHYKGTGEGNKNKEYLKLKN